MNQECKSKLLTLLGERMILEGPEIVSHSRDESFHPSSRPEAVCFPVTEDEVIEIVRLCNRYKIPITPYGAGTSIEGQSIPYGKGISVDLSGMNQILAIHAEDLDCVVQSGLLKNHLNEKLRKSGLFFAAGPLVNASLGGMAATCASGINAVRYGTMRENILSMKFVNPTGQLIKTGGRARKSSAGYNLTNLMIGSEGTLGIITELTLKLHPLPEAFANLYVNFQDLSNAVSAVTEILKNNIKPAAIELLDEMQVHAVNLYSGQKLPEKTTLFIELHGTRMSVDEEMKHIRSILENGGGQQFRSAFDQEERDALWKARADCYYAAQNLFPKSSVYTTDVCIPISNLVRCIEETKHDLDECKIKAPMLGHVGDGNFHMVLFINPDDPDNVKRTQWIHDRLIRRAIEMEGTCTGEHGIGIGKKKYLTQEKGPEAMEAMRAIKKAWDPNQIMNPGKIFE